MAFWKSVSDCSEDELRAERESIKHRAVIDGDEEAFERMSEIDSELIDRSNARYREEHKNDPPKHRWTDANRWEKD